MIKLYNRKTQKYEIETQYKESSLKFLYETFCGRILLKLFIARPLFSKIQAKYYNSPKSQKDIKPFVEKHKIEINDIDLKKFKTFNEFFTRQKSINNQSKQNELIAIADSRLSVYKINNDLSLNIKNSKYTLNEILNNKNIPLKYKNGYCLIFRLAADDYHRYIFIDDGKVEKNYKIKGLLHTVRPIASKYKVYSQNCREVSILKTKHFGTITQIEIGALLIGKINNHNISVFSKTQEKGFFEYGGSTIVILLDKNAKIDKDILLNSYKNIETKVSIGERIGIYD